MSKALWDQHAFHGKISWDTSRFSLINANDSFCRHFRKADEFIRTEAESRGIQVTQGLKLVEVRKDQNLAIFEDVNTGEQVQRTYSNFFCMMPSKANETIGNSNLGDSHGYLDVNPSTLQHTRYDNIFGLGDVHNAPTTKTFYGGFAQLHILRHNIERRLNGLSMNASYDGFAEAPLELGQEKLTWVSHLYNGVESSFDTSSMTAGLKHKKYTVLDKKDLANLLQFKNWGPPYYKTKKTVADVGTATAKSTSNLHPDQKTA